MFYIGLLGLQIVNHDLWFLLWLLIVLLRQILFRHHPDRFLLLLVTKIVFSFAVEVVLTWLRFFTRWAATTDRQFLLLLFIVLVIVRFLSGSFLFFAISSLFSVPVTRLLIDFFICWQNTLWPFVTLGTLFLWITCSTACRLLRSFLVEGPAVTHWALSRRFGVILVLWKCFTSYSHHTFLLLWSFLIKAHHVRCGFAPTLLRWALATLITGCRVRATIRQWGPVVWRLTALVSVAVKVPRVLRQVLEADEIGVFSSDCLAVNKYVVLIVHQLLKSLDS